MTEKEEIEPTLSRKIKIIKVKMEINDTEKGQTIEKSNKVKNWFFEKINEIYTNTVGKTMRKKRKHKLRLSRMKERPLLQILEALQGY